jgi:succinyl-CoA synthetase alpha subunit
MAILIDESTRVLVQGITGNVGAFQSRIMKAYGTNIIAGVTPGKGGLDLEGIPVYDLVEDAIHKHDVNAAISFVPARFAKNAAMEVLACALLPKAFRIMMSWTFCVSQNCRRQLFWGRTHRG